jgi:hypothetical protein
MNTGEPLRNCIPARPEVPSVLSEFAVCGRHEGVLRVFVAKLLD